MADFEINPLIFIFLGAIISSISTGIVYIRKDYVFLIFFLIGIGFLTYGLVKRKHYHQYIQKLEKKTKKQIRNIPGINNNLNNKISSKQKYMQTKNNVHHQSKTIFYNNLNNKHQKRNYIILKHCSHCHNHHNENEYICKKCNNRHFYYMTHHK
ncbi:hypothetical protein HOC99_03060 [Candidatus Woesearchaeota archaeon]|jgi:hypothetical protein|nr:hypothetical protein [Candidatus Woesearchaeota archaeon]MBT4387709.1 hypothetical protein [Candidatus Woesearchaeota archaeon]MBT4595888.1 hypothetical protein [Candidatus Woesearchaeota archaeon]MBT5740774.1 hypothetical protein [Candidatus Woesearchaeota archaeon]MBT7296787.1 hypothetical protein [Candidatus Woesearchaeota archaeon]